MERRVLKYSPCWHMDKFEGLLSTPWSLRMALIARALLFKTVRNTCIDWVLPGVGTVVKLPGCLFNDHGNNKASLVWATTCRLGESGLISGLTMKTVKPGI
jgi:hypothetical protein